MSGRHTSGPWEFNPSTGYVNALPSKHFAHGHSVAKVLLGPGRNTQSDARLIAAAPALLEALEGLLDASECHIFGDECLAERKSARAAIARAKGEA